MGSREGGVKMTTIEIPLTSAVINGDCGTIELPLEDVLRALENCGQTATNWGKDHRCPVCKAECIALNVAYGQKAYLETPCCPICGTKLMRTIDEKESKRD